MRAQPALDNSAKVCNGTGNGKQRPQALEPKAKTEGGQREKPSCHKNLQEPPRHLLNVKGKWQGAVDLDTRRKSLFSIVLWCVM
jgi:hypothetical protein